MNRMFQLLYTNYKLTIQQMQAVPETFSMRHGIMGSLPFMK